MSAGAEGENWFASYCSCVCKHCGKPYVASSAKKRELSNNKRLLSLA